MPLTAKQMLRAAAVPGKGNLVYSIGSFAKRVNFLSQQRRALNLVWSLAVERRLENKPRVAVIGGGLAGVTAAAALIGYGATVDVFERGGRVLHHQRKTAHRRVHPTINAWPFEKISLTTELPFYDWAAGVCSEVAEAIASDFEKTMKALGFEIHTSVTARDLAPIGTKLMRVVTTPKLKKNEGYDLVLITIGFGDEIQNPDFNSTSYWEADNLEMLRDADERFQTFLVSGCGDGGLIDTLRIVYVKFEEGNLAFKLAAKLCGTPLAHNIRLAEEKAAAEPENDRRKITGLLSSAYRKAAREIETKPEYAAAKDMLRDAGGEFGRILYIGDRALAEPYSIKASPIHKLMIAHLAETVGPFKFETSEASADADGQVRLGQYTFDRDETKVIIRHGAVPDFRNLIGERDRSALKAKQIKLKDRCAEQAWPNDYVYPTPPGWPTDRTLRPYTSVRRDMARRAIETVIPGANVIDRPGKFVVDLESPPPASAPRQLFRVPVEYIVESESDAL